MTTFHDPPPQSRRAARQSERTHSSDEQPTVEGFTTFPSQADDTDTSDVSHTPRSAPTSPPAAPVSAPVAPPAASQPAAAASYLNAPPPAVSGQNNSALAPPAPSVPAAAPAAPAASAAADVSQLTRRELRELRAREEAANDTTAAPVVSPAQAAPTQAAAAPAAPAAPTQSAPAPAASTPPIAPTVSAPASDAAPAAAARPSLADLAAAASAAAVAESKPARTADELSFTPDAQVYIEPPALVDPLAVVPEAAAAAAAPTDALSAFESLLANPDGSAKGAPTPAAPRSPLADLPAPSGAAVPSASVAADPVTKVMPAATPEQGAKSDSTATTAKPEQSTRPTVEGLLGFDAAPAATKPQASSTTTGSTQTTLSNARAEFDELARKRLDGDIAAPVATTKPPIAPVAKPTTAPAAQAPAAQASAAPAAAPVIAASGISIGHWSSQAKADDETNNAIVTRTIGSGSSATNALVLPAIPFATDIRGPLTSSGEAMLTGSIDLPSTLSASGVSDRFDKGDIDSLLDLNDSDMVSTDSAPVRAVKAVSTFSNQSVTQTQKPKGTRALTVLLISAASMAVVVAGLLVAAFAFNML
ncbi:Meckel syndrome type 1 protein [Salinibacterium sp. NYA9b]